MKRLATSILLIISITAITAQAPHDFMELLDIFRQGYRTEIPAPLAKKYFDFTPNTDPSFGSRELYVIEIVFVNDRFYALSAGTDSGAGGISESVDLRLFNKVGAFVSELPGFESRLADCADSDFETCVFASDSLLVIAYERTRTDCSTDSVLSIRISIQNIQVTSAGGLIRGKKTKIETRRKYYFTSTKLLSSKDLENMSKEELSIMRNEIFAAHRYRFKSSKWNNYFTQIGWYEPKYDDVTDKLTIIEKLNIKSIVEQEKK